MWVQAMAIKEVPYGTYEVKIEKLELVESKTGKPMVTSWMRIIAGEYQIYFIQESVVHTAFGIHMANEFLRSLDSGIDVTFENFTQYHNLILDIHEAIDGNYEYAVEYGETNKGFKTFKITEVFEAE